MPEKQFELLDNIINTASKVKEIRSSKPRNHNQTYMDIYKKKYVEAKVNLNNALSAYITNIIDTVFSEDRESKITPIDNKDKSKDKGKDKGKDKKDPGTDLFKS